MGYIATVDLAFKVHLLHACVRGVQRCLQRGRVRGYRDDTTSRGDDVVARDGSSCMERHSIWGQMHEPCG